MSFDLLWYPLFILCRIVCFLLLLPCVVLKDLMFCLLQPFRSFLWSVCHSVTFEGSTFNRLFCWPLTSLYIKLPQPSVAHQSVAAL